MRRVQERTVCSVRGHPPRLERRPRKRETHRPQRTILTTRPEQTRLVCTHLNILHAIYVARKRLRMRAHLLRRRERHPAQRWRPDPVLRRPQTHAPPIPRCIVHSTALQSMQLHRTIHAADRTTSQLVSLKRERRNVESPYSHNEHGLQKGWTPKTKTPKAITNSAHTHLPVTSKEASDRGRNPTPNMFCVWSVSTQYGCPASAGGSSPSNRNGHRWIFRSSDTDARMVPSSLSHARRFTQPE
jgi:hypothetical protein